MKRSEDSIPISMLKILTAMPLGLLALFCNSAGAFPIPIVNPSFESPALGPGQYQSSPLVGWTAVAGQPTFVYWNPGSTYPNSSLTTPPPDGNQVMLLGDNFSPGMITQTLGVNLQPNTLYTLTYWVGSRLEFPRGDYEVRLLASGVVLASDHRGYVTPQGIFEQRVITYHSGPTDSGVLSIDIRGTGYTNVNGIAGQVLIDNLQLDATPDTLTLVCPIAVTPQNAFYSSSFKTIYGQGPFTFSILNGSTGGMTLNPATGALTGTPLTKGTFTFTGQVVDSESPPVTATRSCTITVAGLATAAFVKSDLTTQGTWRGVYGGDGSMVAQDTVNLPAYAQSDPSTLSTYLWALDSTDPRCMFVADPQQIDRMCSTFYGSTTFAIDVTIAGGPQPVVLYALDYEPSARIERIDVLDAATGTLLDTQTVTNFSSGINLVWNIYGHVQFKVTALAGPNAVISGVLFGSAQATVSQPVITQNPANASAAIGQTATFTVAASGADLTYQWQSQPSGSTSFANIPGATQATYGTPPLVLSDNATLFRCVVSNSAGAATSTAATLTVLSGPTITQNPSNATVTVGQKATFTVVAIGASLTYQWQSEANGASGFSDISGANSASYTTPVLALSDNGTQFRCVVTGTGGSVTSTAAILTANPASTNLASFVTTDTVTEGSWKGVYGNDGAFIAGDINNPPAYGSLSFSGQLTYVWAASVTNLQALQKGSPSATDRIASCIYNSTPFTIDVNLTTVSHPVTLYALDWDQAARMERIDVLDGTTGTTLDTRTISGFAFGVYLQWNVSGHVQFRITPLSGSNAVISGIFFGPGGTAITQNPSNATVTVGQQANFTVGAVGATLMYQWQSQPNGASGFANISGANSASYTTPVLALADNGTLFRCVVTGSSGSATSTAATLTVSPASTNAASFVTTDTTTEGSWKGVYGQGGIFIAGDTNNPPTYGSVSFSGQLTYIWAASVSNLQALQKGSPTATDRIASCIYNSTPFIIDVNLSGGTHPVTLYALDWDQDGRVERIDVLDGTTGTTLDTRTVSGFFYGAYLQWNVSGHVQFRVTLVSGSNAVISGIFFN